MIPRQLAVLCLQLFTKDDCFGGRAPWETTILPETTSDMFPDHDCPHLPVASGACLTGPPWHGRDNPHTPLTLFVLLCGAIRYGSRHSEDTRCAFLGQHHRHASTGESRSSMCLSAPSCLPWSCDAASSYRPAAVVRDSRPHAKPAARSALARRASRHGVDSQAGGHGQLLRLMARRSGPPTAQLTHIIHSDHTDMRAHETQSWLLYALVLPLVVAALGWGLLRQVHLCACPRHLS